MPRVRDRDEYSCALVLPCGATEHDTPVGACTRVRGGEEGRLTLLRPSGGIFFPTWASKKLLFSAERSDGARPAGGDGHLRRAAPAPAITVDKSRGMTGSCILGRLQSTSLSDQVLVRFEVFD